ncbi:LysR family transcriptional regulator [Frigidibacter albus]|uniref:LysR family transcriptional regulator n=2 Tax=Frigidibacter albus TaxID=1465486 RepID=A0A6L8VBT5_9RHOB|nr:LysR family transcriptional regulator [Frigidibacter albus]NBE29620.1 LysR family transcriptional regulator [Frigidibacter albus]
MTFCWTMGQGLGRCEERGTGRPVRKSDGSKQLTAFRTVMRHRTITEAARALHVSPPSSG